MSAIIAVSHAIETAMLPGTYSSHIRDATIGDEVGSRALQDAVVHNWPGILMPSRLLLKF